MTQNATDGPDEVLQRRFAKAMEDIYINARQEAGYTATYYLQMLRELGALGTARRLLWTDRPSQGFTALWERGRLDLTVENTMLRPEFQELFTDEELEAARERLLQYGWDPGR